MSTVANLLSQKQRLLERLENDSGPNERDEIERLVAKIETGLTWLESNDPVRKVENYRFSDRQTSWN